MVHYFLEGGAFMWPILLTLIFGLGFVIERAYSLMMSAVDSDVFFDTISESIKENGPESAVQVCSETEGPVAAIFHAGLTNMNRGLEEVEKAIQNAGAIEMAFLEKNMIWLNAVITIAPMLGFTGTVVGMIKAFREIAQHSFVGSKQTGLASGVSEALLTTAGGLCIGIPALIFYSLFRGKVQGLVAELEAASTHIMALLAAQYKLSLIHI